MITFDLAVDVLALVPSGLDNGQLHQTLDGLQVRQQSRILCRQRRVIVVLVIVCMHSVSVGQALLVLLRWDLAVGMVTVVVAVAILAGGSVHLLLLHFLLLVLVLLIHCVLVVSVSLGGIN